VYLRRPTRAGGMRGRREKGRREGRRQFCQVGSGASGITLYGQRSRIQICAKEASRRQTSNAAIESWSRARTADSATAENDLRRA